MAIDLDQVVSKRILDRASREGLARARQALQSKGSVQSRQLIDSLEAVPGGAFEVLIFASPYYAVFVHDGSGPAFRDLSRPPFIWYRDPLQDPRLDGGRTPPRVSQLRHLTGEQYRQDRKAGKLIVTRKVGRRQGNPFLSNEPGGGMFGFIEEVGRIAQEETSRAVRKTLGKLFDVKGSVEVSI